MTPLAKKKTAKKTSKGRGSMTTFAAPATAKKNQTVAPPAPPIAEDDAPRRGRRKIFDERRPLITRLSPEQYRHIRQYVLDSDTTAQNFVVDAIREAFETRGLVANAEAFKKPG